MELWIDAQLSPALALWINQFSEEIVACSLRSLNLASADDETIFQQAKLRNAVIVSKDIDFVKLVERYGPPPQIIWITAGNTSNAKMHEIFRKYLPAIITMLNDGEPLIEIGKI
jgi:predicted nuclease of predicted toxin-antitoxin system